MGIESKKFVEDFTFEYCLGEEDRVRCVTISLEDDGRPWTELSDQAYDKACDYIVKKHKADDFVCWSI